MKPALRYIELKSGFSGNGPAWIGLASFSKTGTTVYFNGKALRRGRGISGNHYDIETGEEYWVSGVKKDMTDRHWAGGGLINIERRILEEYLVLTGKTSLDPKKYGIVDVIVDDIAERNYKLENELQLENDFSETIIFRKPNELTIEELEYAIETLTHKAGIVHKKARRLYREFESAFVMELAARQKT